MASTDLGKGGKTSKRDMNNVADLLAMVIDQRFHSIQGSSDSDSDSDDDSSFDDEFSE